MYSITSMTSVCDIVSIEFTVSKKLQDKQTKSCKQTNRQIMEAKRLQSPYNCYKDNNKK